MFVLHVGPSRTGTTVLQKHLFPKAEKHLFLTKRPYTSSAGKWASRMFEIPEVVREVDLLLSSETCDLSEMAPDLILPLCFMAAYSRNPLLEKKLKEVLTWLMTRYSSSFHSICISSEMLSETENSLNALTEPVLGKFPINYLSRVFASVSGVAPAVLACLRDPIPHLASKYLRCVKQRVDKKLRFLTPTEYIDKQIRIDRRRRSASALSPVIHARFLRELHESSFVKVIGFRELVRSKDVFSLLGFTGEQAIAFDSLPRENAADDLGADKVLLEREIVDALKANGYYELIMSSRLYK